MVDDKLALAKNPIWIDPDEYHAYKYFYLEVPISTDNIFVNDERIFSDDFFDNKTYDKDFLKSLLPIGSSVYMPIIEDSNSSFTRKTYDRIGMLTNINLSSRTITIGLDIPNKDKEIDNMLSEIDNDTFHYYARLNIYVRLGGLKLVRNKRKEANVYLLRISRQHDEMKSKANAEDNSKCDLTSGPNVVAANDSDEDTNKNNHCEDDAEEKGGIQKVTVQTPKFSIPFERRILVKPDGTEIDLSNYYTKSQLDTLIKQQQNINNLSSADDINNRYRDNVLDTITASNVESWIAKYIYTDSDRFDHNISCGTKFTIQDGIYNAQWVVVGADTELNKGDIKLTKPHLSLIPATDLGNSTMNDDEVTTSYVGTKMYKETIPALVEALQKVLGDHLLARRVKLTNHVYDGRPCGSAYYTVYANLMCERQVFGKSTYENSYDIGDDIAALPGFKNYKNKIYGSSSFWLRSVYYGCSFVIAYSDSNGSVGASYAVADRSSAVRPLITIG
jgi:hypothetical protein